MGEYTGGLIAELGCRWESGLVGGCVGKWVHKLGCFWLDVWEMGWCMQGWAICGCRSAGLVHKLVHAWVDGLVHASVSEWVGAWMDGLVHAWIDGLVHAWIDGLVCAWIEGLVCAWMGRIGAYIGKCTSWRVCALVVA